MNQLLNLLLGAAAERLAPRMEASQNRFIAGLGRGINRVNALDDRITNWGNQQLENVGNNILGLFSPRPSADNYSRSIGDMAQRYIDGALDYSPDNNLPSDASQRVAQRAQDRLDEEALGGRPQQPSAGSGPRPSRGVGTRGGEVLARRTGDVRNDRAMEAMAESLLGQSATQRMSQSAQQARNAMMNMFRGSER